MQKEDFNNLINSLDEEINVIDKSIINTIKAKFPYCEIIHNISFLKAHVEKDINFSDILTTTALYSSNRKRLFHLMHPKIKIDNSRKNKKTLRFEEWLNNSHFDKGPNKNENLIKKSIEDNDYLTTETLAEMYVKQGHYERAIQAYHILCLKYPKKSSFFADRIGQIKNKIL